MLQRDWSGCRPGAGSARLYRDRLGAQGRGCGALAAAGVAGSTAGSDGSRLHRTRGQCGAPSCWWSPLWPVQQRRLWPAGGAGRSSNRGAARAVQHQPVWLASPHSSGAARHAGGQRRADRPEQLGAGAGRHEVSRRLQRQQVCARRLFGYPASRAGRQRRPYQPH